uniref:Uncharacterized protein n=1 Tax=Pithovirus LCPAC403 TaxID=2506596 RepID=A0A481ZAE4_9VIRU|nr:MAG: hypothetical protein LCPAC403_00270 [Pithovirus LCPAC403]
MSLSSDVKMASKIDRIKILKDHEKNLHNEQIKRNEEMVEKWRQYMDKENEKRKAIYGPSFRRRGGTRFASMCGSIMEVKSPRKTVS